MPKTKNTQLAKVESSEVTVAKLATVKKIICPDATDAELQLFALHCNQTGLDPFSNQIYLIKRQGKPTFQTSIDGLRIVAERSGKYQGQTEVEYGKPVQVSMSYRTYENGTAKRVNITKTVPEYAKVGVLRSDFTAPLYAVAYFEEYLPSFPNQTMWIKMPRIMLAKVAEALAIRKAFPNTLVGIYSQDEMAQSDDKPRIKEVQEMKVKEEPKEEVKEEPVEMGFNEDDLKQLDLIEAIYQLSEKLGNDHDKTDEIILTNYKKPIDKLTSEKLLVIHDVLTRKVEKNGKQ